MTTLYLSDLDGTLLASDGTISTVTRDTINRLIGERGMLFAFATARSFESARVVLAGLHVRGAAAVYGGALIVDARSGEVLKRHTLSPDVVASVLDECHARELPPLVYEYRDGSDRVKWDRTNESAGIRSYSATRHGDRRLSPVESGAELAGDGVFYLTIIGEQAPIESAAAVLAESLAGRAHLVVQRDTYNPEEYWLEISAVDANKAVAAGELRSLYGADRLVCFGDNHNDLPMFAVADESYAMANAAPAVQAAATAVIGSNDADAVAGFLATRLR